MENKTFKIGDKVKWVDGMGFEAHGIVIDHVTEYQIKVLSRAGILFIKRTILEHDN